MVVVLHTDVVEYSPNCVAEDVRNVDGVFGSAHIIDRDGKFAAYDCTYRMSVEGTNMLLMSVCAIGKELHVKRHVMPSEHVDSMATDYANGLRPY